MSIRVLPIEQAVADEVRATLRSPGYGHPAAVEAATGYGPCRLCLEPFAEGRDRRILFTHDEFRGIEELPLPGPVFVHADECTPYAADGFPERLRFLPLTLNAYERGRELRAQVRLAPGADVDAELERLLADPGIAYVHIRNTEAGCFVARAVGG